MDIAEIEKQARKRERERLTLIVQGMINDNNPRDAYTQEDVTIKQSENAVLQQVIEILGRLT